MNESSLDEIIPGLYLGSWLQSKDLELLRGKGITHIINLSLLSNYYENEFTYYKIEINDDEDEDISKFFNKSNKFIYNALWRGGKVFVHCLAGISRSPTIVLAFLIRKRKLTFEDAFKLLKEKRSKIDPNAGFIKQLEEYSKRTFQPLVKI